MTGSLQLPGGMNVLDRSVDTAMRHPLYPFALEELLCRRIGQGAEPAVHLWRHPRAFIMGLRDSRLPQAVQAKNWLENQGYMTAVRNSGGAAVPLDLGVVNVTLMLRKEEGDVDHRKDFERMYMLIRDALGMMTGGVRRGEITGSFCPGDYDLSIGGRKFCGIAQRRQQRAIGVQAFVIVEGKGEDKAALARAFYDIAAEDAKQEQFPLVEQGSMASLSECLHEPISAKRFVDCLRESCMENGAIDNQHGVELPTDAEIHEMIDQMVNRYGIR